MASNYQPILTDNFLSAHWGDEFLRFKGSPKDMALLSSLTTWAQKRAQKETAAESAFIGVFFKGIWGYLASGENGSSEYYTLEPQFSIPRAGQQGGTGAADLALGFYERLGVAGTPQVLCEFKDVRSGLDNPQNRKGNNRSPIKQCADYLKEASNSLFGNEPIQPTWGIVTDMNEFRLYWRKNMPSKFQRFLISPTINDDVAPLIGKSEASAFQRFIFWKLFQPDLLLTIGGPCQLERLLTEQWVQEAAIEDAFYREYRGYRQYVFENLTSYNPDFKGTKGGLVRLTQRFLDRCIFVLFCEDMGVILNFPPGILRDILSKVSNDPDYDPDDDAAWTKVKRLFSSMEKGTPFRNIPINRFNGGLFSLEPELESLHIPTKLFCAKSQGSNAELLIFDKRTLLFFSAFYNFGVSQSTLSQSISTYTLGRIFEQSITELEFMEAEAEGRPSIAGLTKRKRDGVYYTPEWITNYIVEETVGCYLTEIRSGLALDPLPVFTDDELTHYHRARKTGKKDKRFNTERIEKYYLNLNAYAEALDEIKILDPACGSGAFLIQTLDRLVAERRWLASERGRLMGGESFFDSDAISKEVMSKNIYGVDINEESVEITRLALWLHTALPNRPLTTLDHNIRCGNSLIDPDFYNFKQEKLLTEDEQERINAFDWQKSFPEVFIREEGRIGFDCVIGNPPYVKLQHFRQILPDVAEYLVVAKKAGGTPLYESTQRNNFDLFLPFIERGISLLNQNGRMGYIAPSVWANSEYGDCLRDSLLKTRNLERWVDFKDFPVFDEAMTYTALQFFRGCAVSDILCGFAPDGVIGTIDWLKPDATISYNSLEQEETWVFLTDQEKQLINRISVGTTSLVDYPGVSSIFQGIITSADHIYHLERLGPNLYLQNPKGEEVRKINIEDTIMRPLVSGEAAKRYQTPVIRKFLLFPYDDSNTQERLLLPKELEKNFPMAWAYLQENEKFLRARENGVFDDNYWYRFGRSQNIGKQKLKKLGIAQLAPGIRAFYDERGKVCFNNVRVNGIITENDDLAWYLLGILNSRVSDFVFRRISKPKEKRPSGSYFEANKQYIAPLPIPHADNNQKESVIHLARHLQKLHSLRREIVGKIEDRLKSDQMFPIDHKANWIWAEVGDLKAWVKLNPERLSGRALTAWAKRKIDEKVFEFFAKIQPFFIFGSTMCVDSKDGEISFYVGDNKIVQIFVSDNEEPLILAQWRIVARDSFVSDSLNVNNVISKLLKLKSTDNQAIINQVNKFNSELETVEDEIRSFERQMDDLVYNIYAIAEDEHRLIEADTVSRWNSRIPFPPIYQNLQSTYKVAFSSVPS